MYGLITQSIDQILRLIYQPICPLCERLAELSGLCSVCNPFLPISGLQCLRCSNPLAHPSLGCGRCQNLLSPDIERVHSSLLLNQDSLKLLRLIKFQNRREWLSLFKPFVERTCFPWSSESAVLIPVPLFPEKFLVRGFNQSEILSDWIQASHARCSISYGLEKIRNTLPQSALSKSERTKNLSRSFSWNSKYKVPEVAILIDDVYTTGETLNSCARVLKKQGVQTIYAWTLFRTPDSNYNMQ